MNGAKHRCLLIEKLLPQAISCKVAVGVPHQLSVESIVEHYGLIGVFIGAGIEGETVAFVGGLLAHRGLLPFWAVALAASVGSFCSDQLLFFAGRFASGNNRVRKVVARPAFAHVTSLLERYPTAFILAFRFIYGLRVVSPIAIGMSRLPIRKFFILNALAAAIWGPLISGVGFVFGGGLERIFGS